MLITQLKAIIKEFSGSFLQMIRSNFVPQDRQVIIALQRYIEQLTHEGWRDDQPIDYDNFTSFLLSTHQSDLINREYLKGSSLVASFCREWANENSFGNTYGKFIPLRKVPNFIPEIIAQNPVELPRSLPDFHRQDKQVNVNRGPAPKVLYAREIFLGKDVPPVNYYRLNVFNHLVEENGKVRVEHLLHAFPNSGKDVENSLNSKIKFQVEGDERYGEVPMHFTGEWQTIPSLNMYDTITAIAADGDLEYFGPAPDTNCYYVRTKAGDVVDSTLTLNIVQSPIAPLNKNQPLPTSEKAEQFIRTIRFFSSEKAILIPDDISKEELIGAIVNFLRTFHEIDPDDLDLAHDLRDAVDDYEVFNLRIANQTGICCDRAMLFMLYADRLGIQANYISSDVHDFIEYNLNDTWHQVCVGGGTSSILQIKRLPYLQPRLTHSLTSTDMTQKVFDALAFPKTESLHRLSETFFEQLPTENLEALLANLPQSIKNPATLIQLETKLEQILASRTCTPMNK